MIALSSIRGHAERGSVPLALVVVITLAGIMAALVVTTIGSSRAARFDAQYTEVIQAADTGAQDGAQRLLRAYTPTQLATLPGPVTGSGALGDIPYTWRAERIDLVTWRVTSTASRPTNDVERTVVIDVIGQRRPKYGVFIDVGWNFAGNTRVESFGGGGAPSIIATNGYVDIKGSTTVGEVHLYNWGSDPNASRCRSNSAGACPAAETVDERLSVGPGEVINTQELVTQRSRPPCPATLAAYTASSYPGDGGGVGTLGVTDTTTTLCFSSANFNRNVTVLGTVRMFVYGDLLVTGHTQVNCAGNACPNAPVASTPPNAAALEIQVSGTRGNTTERTVVELKAQSRVAAVVFAPESLCKVGAGVHVYGSLACRELRSVGNVRVFYDERLPGTGVQNFDMRQWSER